MGNLKAIMEQTNLNKKVEVKIITEGKLVDEYDFFDKFVNLRYNKKNKEVVFPSREVFTELFYAMKAIENYVNIEDKDLKKMFKKDAKNFTKQFYTNFIDWIESIE